MKIAIETRRCRKLLDHHVIPTKLYGCHKRASVRLLTIVSICAMSMPTMNRGVYSPSVKAECKRSMLRIETRKLSLSGATPHWIKNNTIEPRDSEDRSPA